MDPKIGFSIGSLSDPFVGNLAGLESGKGTLQVGIRAITVLGSLVWGGIRLAVDVFLYRNDYF